MLLSFSLILCKLKISVFKSGYFFSFYLLAHSHLTNFLNTYPKKQNFWFSDTTGINCSFLSLFMPLWYNWFLHFSFIFFHFLIFCIFLWLFSFSLLSFMHTNPTHKEKTQKPIKHRRLLHLAFLLPKSRLRIVWVAQKFSNQLKLTRID